MSEAAKSEVAWRGDKVNVQVVYPLTQMLELEYLHTLGYNVYIYYIILQ